MFNFEISLLLPSNKGEYESLYEELLSTDWKALFQDLNVSATWDLFHSKLIDKYVPSVKFSSTKVKSCPMWLNREVLKFIRSKHRAWNMCLATRRKSDFVAYSKIRNHCTLTVRKARFLFGANLATNVKPNLKKFWSYIC